MRAALSYSILALFAVGLARGGYRVAALERDELEAVGDVRPLAPTHEHGEDSPTLRLVSAEIEAGEDVMFEVCSENDLEETTWRDTVEFAVWRPDEQEIVVRAPTDHHLFRSVQRSSRGSCAVIGRGRDVPMGGTYAIEVIWPGRQLSPQIAGTRLRGRITAHRPLAPSDALAVVAILMAAILMAVREVIGIRRPTGLAAADADGAGGEETTDRPTPVPPSVAGPGAVPSIVETLVRVAAALVLLAVAIVGLGWLPVGGATGAMARGSILAAAQVLLAFGLVVAASPGWDGRRAALGFGRPDRLRWLLWIAPLIGILVSVAGRFLSRAVNELWPPAYEASIEALVAWPSGILGVALVSVLVPVAEEIFFRGLVFGSLSRRFGGLIAFLITTLFFVAAHAPQVWGSVGPLASLLVTAVVLTGLRWATGSTTVPVVAHLAHNAAISITAVLASS